MLPKVDGRGTTSGYKKYEDEDLQGRSGHAMCTFRIRALAVVMPHRAGLADPARLRATVLPGPAIAHVAGHRRVGVTFVSAVLLGFEPFEM